MCKEETSTTKARSSNWLFIREEATMLKTKVVIKTLLVRSVRRIFIRVRLLGDICPEFFQVSQLATQIS